MKKPFGQRDGPTEPLSQDAADTEDGPTLRVYVPEHGDASHLPSFELSAESLTEPRWAPALPSFDETTRSGFYETMTRQRGDLYEDAATLERRPEPELPRFPTGGGAWQPAPSSPAWASGTPDRPLPSAPLPLLPPRSAPFPLVPRAPGARPAPLRLPLPPVAALPTPSRPRPSGQPPAPSRPIPSRPPPAPSRPIPSRPPPAPSRPMPSRPPPTPSHPPSFPSRPPAMASAPRTEPIDDDPIIEIAPELAVGAGDAFHDEHAFPTDVDLAPPFSDPSAASSLPSAPPPPRAPMTTLPGVRNRSPRPPAVAGASDERRSVRHPLLALRPRLRVTSDKTALSVAVGVFSALAVAGILSAIVFVATRDDAPPAGGAPPATRPVATQAAAATTTSLQPAAAAAESEPNPAGAACELSQPPRKLSGAVLPTVPPMVSSAPGERHVAVGFAGAPHHAIGLIVNVEDLSTEVRLSEQTSRPVFRVTPLPHRSPVTFAVDHDDARVLGLRTVPARAPFQLGLAREDLVRIDPGREPSVIWPGGGSGGIGEPQFASIDGKGHAVALRRGRGAGEIVFGWLAQSGARDTDLSRIDLGPREVGTPDIATSDDTALVVSAARGLGERWHLYGALASVGKAAGPARRIEPSDTGGNEIAPLVVAHPRGGWLLRWLEGQPGAWRVRSRLLDASLAPKGAIIELAGPDAVSEAPGALIVRKGRVLALHQQSAGRANELWGSVLRCP